MDKSQIQLHPPRLRNDYRVLVPNIDIDGNEIGCLQPPEVAVPLGTYTSWNLYPDDHPARTDLVGLSGAFLQFEVDRQQRESIKDSRQSILERYPTQADYHEAFRAACQRLVRQGFLLETEVSALLEKHAKRYQDLTGASQ